MGTFHIKHQLTDYVLDLLPAEERQAVARHVANCEECRIALQHEREIGRLVYGTLNTVTKPPNGRLQALMPPIPTRRVSALTLLANYRQWAVAWALLVAMMGVFIFGGNGGYNGLNQTASSQLVTFSALDPVGTAESVIANESGTLLSTTVELTVPVEHSREFINAPIEHNPPPVPMPVAPQVTPAPAATYYQ